MNEPSPYLTNPTSPLVRIGVAVFFLLLAAGAIVFSAKQYERTHPPGWDDAIKETNDSSHATDADADAGLKDKSEARNAN
jgi:hypothetical protein